MTDGGLDLEPAREGWARVIRRRLPAALLVLAVAIAGAVAGLLVGGATPAHVEIAGSDTKVWVDPGDDVDRFGVQGLVTLRRPTSRTFLGETIGVRAVIDLDASELIGPNGEFDPDVVPAYVQAYSDPEQLVSDIRHALFVHLLWFTAGGAVTALLLAAAVAAYRRWRRGYERKHWPNAEERHRARAYRAPERRVVARVIVAVLLIAVIATIPSARRHPPAPTPVAGESIFGGGPLAGVEVDGLLRPALLAAESYIQEYAGETDDYYAALRDELVAHLNESPVELPAGSDDSDGGGDVAHFGFVTDRHCNTGMDRVDVALMKKFGVTTLVSAGDDAFSGTFSFESACTRTLAERSHRAGITDVFAAGNHDSPQTIADEKSQKIKTLTGDVVSVGGLNFIGSPDPRTSRYGEGIRPSSKSEQRQLVDAQGRSVGEKACAADGPVIAMLHDPRAGAAALDAGCGKVVLALDGHTHQQRGPNAVPLPSGQAGYQFTGGSAGGAPAEQSIERSFAASLTVGPLNHDADVYIVTVDRNTGALIGITDFTFSPAQDITVTQLPAGG